MAVQASPRYPSRKALAADAAKAKEKRLKIFVAIGGVVLLLVLVFEVPKTLKELSGNSASSTSAPVAVATGTATATAAPPAAAPIPGLKRIDRLASKDPFIPQVSSGTNPASGATASSGSTTAAGPPVSAKHFKAKDPFIAQIAIPVASTATPTSSPSTTGPAAATTSSAGTGKYVVVLTTVAAAKGVAPAKRAEVAAKNLGLPNVQITTASTTKGSPYTIVSGPYKTNAGAQLELVRALRVGYSQAYTRSLPSSLSSTKAGGF